MNFVIPVIVGAVIGYITNWLAIKMLFRPYTEKKLFGIHIPFTPGLIPKEINRIAKSVGETIGEYLLSPEVILETLFDKGKDDNIKNWVNNCIEKLKMNPKSIKETLKGVAAEKYDIIYDASEKKVTEFICKSVKSKEFRDYINDIIKQKINEEHKDNLYSELREKLKLIIQKVSFSEDTRNEIKRILEHKYDQLKENNESISSVIPESIIKMIKTYIIEHDGDIVKVLREAIESPVMKRRIKAIISELVEQNTNRLITIFLNPDSIAEKVFESIEKYLNDPSNSKSIVMVLTTSLDKLLQSNVSSILSSVSSEHRERGISEAVDLIVSYISDEERQSRIFDLAEEKINKSRIKDSILELISDGIDNILQSQELSGHISIIVHDGIEWIVNKPVSFVFGGVDTLMIDTMADLTNELLDGFVKDRLPYFMQMLNIPKIVEDRINSFDIVFAEGIIIDIANRELKAITWLGALLGGIMGILTPLIQMI